MFRPQKLYSTDDEVLRHAQIMPNGKKIQSVQLSFYFVLRLQISHDRLRPC